MLNLNITALGRLTRDIERRANSKGELFFTGTIAVPIGKDNTEFVDITCSERFEKILNYFSKGSAIHVSGLPKANAYQDKQNELKAKLQIYVNEISFVPQDKRELTIEPTTSLPKSEFIPF